jgi:hypothetical protein
MTLNVIRWAISFQFQLRQVQRELEETRVTNSSLGERIEMLSAHSSPPGPRSLLHEMECLDTSSEYELILHNDDTSKQLDGVSCISIRCIASRKLVQWYTVILYLYLISTQNLSWVPRYLDFLCFLCLSRQIYDNVSGVAMNTDQICIQLPFMFIS